MEINRSAYRDILEQTAARHVRLVAVSKKQPLRKIEELYALGHRDFGESYAQELREKQALLPSDIRWHFIGHLQVNKVKYIAPFASMIQSVDSMALLDRIEIEAKKNARRIDVLLQIRIAEEATKFGILPSEAPLWMESIAAKEYSSLCIRGLMGMATFTDNIAVVRREFRALKKLFDTNPFKGASFAKWDTLSMGMSQDYLVAMEEGSSLVRVGSLIFGERTA